ncbi:MAG: CoB--CoM heterodisulfide reductase iron-sulfur subunit B family protein [Candidatus Verstraetearchaeota archaeon]|nr:CoB--CoM heterodisulfide reductase iron-sulfur subunit B family protein [Candidatus Verstraetearchaeota archaeon]
MGTKTNTKSSSTKYGYFLGCVMPAKMPWAEKATFLVSKHLGLDFDYLKESLCCVRPGVWKAINPDWWLTLTSQNLANAEKQNVVIVDSCNGCYISHYECLQELKEDPEKLEMVNRNLEKAGMKLALKTDVKHFLQVLYEDVGIARIKKAVVNPLNIRIMRHIGCHARKHDERFPNYFDEILKATGVEIVDTPYDKTCCGLLLYFSDPNSSIFHRIGAKMQTAKELNIDAYALICSGCYDQFERAVKIYKEEKGIVFETPIVHFSELLALAFGYKPEDFGMMYCRPIPPTKLIQKLKEGK